MWKFIVIVFVVLVVFVGEDEYLVDCFYLFFFVLLLEGDVVVLGDLCDWLVEWKWDGICV